MTKEEALAAIKLLSALESWALSQQAQMPDYIHDDLRRSMEVLDRVVLEKPTGLDGLEDMSAMNKRPLKEKYIYGTPLSDAMTGKTKP